MTVIVQTEVTTDLQYQMRLKKASGCTVIPFLAQMKESKLKFLHKLQNKVYSSSLQIIQERWIDGLLIFFTGVSDW